MAQSSKNLLAVLLIVTMIISLMGTITAISVLMSYGGYSNVPVSLDKPEEASGRVTVYLASPPADATAKVAVTVSPSEDGG